MKPGQIDTAMVLAAGFGKRLRPITETIPKPLVPVGGKTMLDRTLHRLVESGIARAVINIHYRGQQIIDHCSALKEPDCVISDERDLIRDTAGGIVKALPELGEKPFVLLNADTFWVEDGPSALARMVDLFDPSTMDMLLLTCRLSDATGHSGGSDFVICEGGRLARAQKDDPDGLIYAGAAILSPSIFKNASDEPHSLNVYFDHAIASDRLFGHVLEQGHWITVGTPAGLLAAEAKLAELGH